MEMDKKNINIKIPIK